MRKNTAGTGKSLVSGNALKIMFRFTAGDRGRPWEPVVYTVVMFNNEKKDKRKFKPMTTKVKFEMKPVYGYNNIVIKGYNQLSRMQQNKLILIADNKKGNWDNHSLTTMVFTFPRGLMVHEFDKIVLEFSNVIQG